MTATHKDPNYIAIWGWLLLLTLIELGTTQLPIGRLSIAVLLVGEALTKALLVAMYFMHLKFEKKTLAIIATCPLILCVFLSLMLLPDSSGAMDSVVPVTPAGQTAAPASEGAAPAPEGSAPAPEGAATSGEAPAAPSSDGK